MEQTTAIPRFAFLLGTLVVSLLVCLIAPSACAENAPGRNPHGARLLDILYRADEDAFAKLINQDAYVNRSIHGLNLSGSALQTAREALKRGIASGDVSILKQLKRSEYELKLVRYELRENSSLQTIRVIYSADEDLFGALSYLTFELDDQGRIVDWYDYGLGSKFTETARLGVTYLTAEAGQASRPSAAGAKSATETKALILFNQAMKAGDAATAYLALEDVPEFFKRTRLWATLRTTLALDIDEATYDQALKELFDRFPDDPELSLVFLDHYLNQGEFEKLLNAVRSLQRHLVSDGAMGGLECYALSELGRFRQADAACAAAIAIEPDLVLVHAFNLELQKKTHNVEGVIKAFEAAREAFRIPLTKDDVSSVSKLDWLRDDPQFKSWLKTLDP